MFSRKTKCHALLGAMIFSVSLFSNPVSAQTTGHCYQPNSYSLWNVFGVDPYQRSTFPATQSRTAPPVRWQSPSRSPAFNQTGVSDPSFEYPVAPMGVVSQWNEMAQPIIYPPGNIVEDSNEYSVNQPIQTWEPTVIDSNLSSLDWVDSNSVPSQSGYLPLETPFETVVSSENSIIGTPIAPGEVTAVETDLAPSKAADLGDAASSSSDVKIEPPQAEQPTPADSTDLDIITRKELTELRQQLSEAMIRARAAEERAYASERSVKAANSAAQAKIAELKQKISEAEQTENATPPELKKTKAEKIVTDQPNPDLSDELRQKMEDQVKSSHEKIKRRFDRQIQKLMDAGKLETSPQVEKLTAKRDSQLKQSEAKIRQSFELKIEKE